MIDRTQASAQRPRVADLPREARASHPNLHLAGNAFALHFVSLIADAERKHFGSYQYSVDFDFAPIQAARPAAVRSIEIEPVEFPSDSDVAPRERRWSVRGCQLAS